MRVGYEMVVANEARSVEKRLVGLKYYLLISDNFDE